MYRWFLHCAPYIKNISFEMNEQIQCWLTSLAILGIVGRNLESLRLFTETAVLVDIEDAGWLHLLPNLCSLELEQVLAFPISADLPTCLTSLQLNNVGLTGAPPCLAKCGNLHTVSLQALRPPPPSQQRGDGGGGAAIVDALGPDLTSLLQCSELQNLNLSYFPTAPLPDCLGSLTKLTALTLNNCPILGHNAITEALAPLVKLTALQRFEMRDSGLLRVPPAIIQLTSLKTLLLGYNEFQSEDIIPQGPYLTNLELLALSDSIREPTSFEEAIVRPLLAAKRLQVLRVGRNWGLTLYGDDIKILIKDKPGFRKLEYSEDMLAEDLDIQSLIKDHPNVVFRILD
jgi:Leucine-rich repeat (LRR) protein